MTLNLHLTTPLHIKFLFYIFTNIFQHCASVCIYFVNRVMLIIVIVHMYRVLFIEGHKIE